MTGRGAAHADALLARHGRPPAPPVRTAVATADGPWCTRCEQPAARVVSAYWDPAGTRLCPDCCLAVAAGYGPDPTNWPPHPNQLTTQGMAA